MCNHIHSKQSSAESLRSFPSTPFSTQWKPISKPLWRCEWELKFSKRLLLLNGILYAYCSTSPPSLQQVIHPLSFYLSVTVKNLYASFLHCLVTVWPLLLLLLWFIEKGESLSNRGTKKMGEQRAFIENQ